MIFAAAGGSCEAAQTAALVMDSKAVQLLPSSAVFVAGYGNVTTYYSTFNGTTGNFLIDSSRGSAVSGELRPRTNSNSILEGAYGQATELAVIDYGSYALTIPTSDSDGNGLQDVLQFNQSGTFTGTGSGYSVAGGNTFSITVKFTRNTNQSAGTYSATTVNSLNQTNTVTGVYLLNAYSGTATYTRGTTNTLSLSLTGRNPGSKLINGSTTYTVTNAGSTLSCAAFTARDAEGVSYQVKAATLTRTARTYRGTISVADGLPETYWADFTGYVLEITDPNDGDNDGVPDLTDPDAIVIAPTITTQPSSKTAAVGDTVTFTVLASGSPAPTYQWKKGGVAINGATSSTLTLTAVDATAAGTYSVAAANSAGTVSSSNAILTIVPAGTLSPPIISTQPASHTIAIGGTVSLSVSASGGQTYQWKKNGTALLGATSPILVITNAQASHAANYSVAVSNGTGSTSSASATLAVLNTADRGRLLNVSVRTTTGTGDNVLIVGFVLGGSGTSGGKNLLIRGLGPRLADFGVTNALADPVIQLILQGSSVIASQNDNWSGDALIAGLGQTVGATPLTLSTSKDAALAGSIGSGAYSLKVLGAANTSGTTLAEIYDGQPTETSSALPGLINISARAAMSNDNPLIAGFVITGSTAKTVLIRAVGPYLSQYFGSAAMQNPQLALYGKSAGMDTLVASNDDWGGVAAISATAQSLGAFALPDSSSKDAVLLITLEPGVYSAQVTSKDGSSGIALLEVYATP